MTTQLWANYTIPSYKSADGYISASTVLTDDANLVCNVEASNTYYIRGCLFFNDVNSGLQVALNGTCTVASMKTVIRIYDSSGLQVLGEISALGVPVSHSKHISGFHMLAIDGSIETTNAGTLLVQWAQATSDPSSLTLYRNSFFELIKVHT